MQNHADNLKHAVRLHFDAALGVRDMIAADIAEAEATLLAGVGQPLTADMVEAALAPFRGGVAAATALLDAAKTLL